MEPTDPGKTGPNAGRYDGGRIWGPVIPALEQHSHRVFAPTLHNEHASTLTGHIEHVCDIMASHDLQEVILAGHR